MTMSRLARKMTQTNFDLANVYPGLRMSDGLVEELLPDHTLGVWFRGSVAHGMYRPSTDPNSFDDVDLMATFVPTVTNTFGLGSMKGENTKGNHDRFIGEFDSVAYALPKFVRLLVKGNPNVLSSLYLRDEDYLYKSPTMNRLINNRELFSSMRVYQSFAGYASSQLHRMENWKFEGYMGDKRKSLVNKYGYDTKNAAHLIRLLRMAVEFLESGKLTVFRDDAKELLEYKDGKYELEEVKAHAEELFSEANFLKDKASNHLPKSVDVRKVDELLIWELTSHWKERL